MNAGNRRQRRPRQGFTLLELLMVVIILGILATLAVPQYIKQVERSRMSEAVSMLGQIRNSEIRYRAETQNWTGVLTALDFDPLDVMGNAYFTYSVAIGGTGFIASAVRNASSFLAGAGCVANYKLTLDEGGNWTGRDCQTL